MPYTCARDSLNMGLEGITVEHRWGKRVPLDLMVTLDWGVAKGVAGRLRDASLSGGYVEGVRLIPLWAEVCVDFPGVCGSQAASNRVTGNVVRSEPDGIAVEWTEFAPPAVRRIIDAFDRSVVPADNASGTPPGPIRATDLARCDRAR